MRIGNKIFPYPILNSNQNNSGYEKVGIRFTVELDESENLIIENEMIVLKNAVIETDSEYLISMYRNESVKFACLVSCSDSIYRRSFEIGLEPTTIRIPLSDLKNRVEISAFGYVVTKNLYYESSEFHEDYHGYKFLLEKSNILATDDGYNFDIKVDDAKDNRVDSIFTITKDEENQKNVTFEINQNRIVIYLGKNAFSNYEALKTTNTTQNILFSTILVPVLSEALSTIIKNQDYETIEDVYADYNWMISVGNRYKLHYKKDMTLIDIQENSPFVLSQELINHTTSNALKDLENILMNSGEESND